MNSFIIIIIIVIIIIIRSIWMVMIFFKKKIQLNFRLRSNELIQKGKGMNMKKYFRGMVNL